jgi:hypothetical protein
MRFTDPPLTCRHCGFADPDLKAFEPCRRCGRIYEPPDEPPSPLVPASWNSDPPYALLLIVAAVCLGGFYLDSQHVMGLSVPGDPLYWRPLVVGLAVVAVLIVKVLRHLMPDEPIVRQD